LDAAGKKAWDDKRALETKEGDTFFAADKLAAGFATMTEEAKTAYYTEFLTWSKAVVATCKADGEKSANC